MGPPGRGVNAEKQDILGPRVTPWPVLAVKQAREATPVSKARRGRLARPVLSFAVAGASKALRVTPVSKVNAVRPASAVKAHLVMPARRENEVPPGPKGTLDVPAHAAQRLRVRQVPPVAWAPLERKAQPDSQVLKARPLPALPGQPARAERGGHKGRAARLVLKAELAS